MSDIDNELRAHFDKIGKPAKYGTAGFRDLATYMPYVLYFLSNKDFLQSRSFRCPLEQDPTF